MKAKILENLDTILQHLFPYGERKGEEFCIGNLQGEKGNSLNIRLSGERKGLWLDRATGDQGDIISLWQEVKGFSSFKETLENLKEFCGLDKNEDFAPKKVFAGKWDYLTETGDLVCSILRYNIGDKKQFIQKLPDGSTGIPAIRTLYNLERFAWYNRVIFVEGEKTAKALMDKGILATSVIGGSNSVLDKTDFTPLLKKKTIIWRDNDEAGYKFQKKLENHFDKIGYTNWVSLLIPKEKLKENLGKTWDAYDLIEEGGDPEKFISTAELDEEILDGNFLSDLIESEEPPKDIISKRLLTENGTLIIAGESKAGKSDFVLGLLISMAVGKPFLGFESTKQLKIFLFQNELEKCYVGERMRNYGFSQNDIKLADKNIFTTNRTYKYELNKKGAEILRSTLDRLKRTQNWIPDIICVDPLYRINPGEENNNDDAKSFLYALEDIRRHINPKGGTVIVHHLRKKNNQKGIIEDPFQAIAGASVFRRDYTSGLVLTKISDSIDSRERRLYFEIRNSKPKEDRLDSMVVKKDLETGRWVEVNSMSQRVVMQDYGEKLDEERTRKKDVIIDLIKSNGAEGIRFTESGFIHKFDGTDGLGSSATIHKLLKTYFAKGFIKFEKSLDGDYYLCVKNMFYQGKPIRPTHHKMTGNLSLMPVERQNVWIEDKN